MAESNLPVAAVWMLPSNALRAPLPDSADRSCEREPLIPDTNDLCEALTPLISAAIARQARQRRYTP